MKAVENELNKSIKRHLESGKYNLISKTEKTKSITASLRVAVGQCRRVKKLASSEKWGERKNSGKREEDSM